VLAHPWLGGSAPDTPLPPAALAAIRTFNADNEFKRAAVGMVAKTLKPSDVAELRAAFAKADKDGSGHLSRSEMVTVLREMGLNEKEGLVASVSVDADHDGRISWEVCCRSS